MLAIRVGYIYADNKGNKRRVIAVGNEFAPHDHTTDKNWLAYELLTPEPKNIIGNRKGYSPHGSPIYYISKRAFNSWASSIIGTPEFDNTTLKFMSLESKRLKENRSKSAGIENYWMQYDELECYKVNVRVWHFKFGAGIIKSISDGQFNNGRKALITTIEFDSGKQSEIVVNDLPKEKFDLEPIIH